MTAPGDPTVAAGDVSVLYSCSGGSIVLPTPLVLVDRLDGGHLVVNPPRVVWERSELTAEELTQWSFLVASAGRAMLDVLPQLDGGCINYWEAGNWSLHDDAEPQGRKRAADHRQVHMHLLGRSRDATAWPWGEAPSFPSFAQRHAFAATLAPLQSVECARVVERAAALFARYTSA